MTSEFAIAVHALVYLNHRGVSLASEELAENICTNPVCIRRVMGKLKRAGMIETKEGLGGGYRVADAPEEQSLRRIAEALGIDAVKASWHSGGMDKKCMIASGMAGIMDGIIGGMNAVCREYLEGITIADIENQIFGGAEE